MGHCKFLRSWEDNIFKKNENTMRNNKQNIQEITYKKRNYSRTKEGRV